MNKILTIGISFLFFSCANRNKSTELGIQEIHFEGAHSEICERIPEYKFIPLETRPDNLIGLIDRVEIYNDRIYLIDAFVSKTIQVYDINGNYISQIGNRGDGPEEYISPSYFHLDKENQTIVIIDQMKNQSIKYDLNTYQHISTKDFPFYFVSHMQLADKSNAWFHSLGFKHARDEYYIQITDSTYQNNTYFLEAPFITSVGIWTRNTFYKNKDKTYFYMPFNPVIYEITSQGPEPVYKLSIESNIFPPDAFMQSIVEDGSRDYSRDLLFSDYVAAYSISETDDFIAIAYLIKNKMNVGIYNKHKKKSYEYPEFTENLLLGGMNLPFVGTYQDYFIGSISPSSFKHTYVKQDELRAIAADVSEEDNPIICLIKFN